MSEWSDYDGDDDAAYENDLSSYFSWQDALPDAGSAVVVPSDAAEAEGDAAMASQKRGGRPADVDIDGRTLRLLHEDGYTNEEIAQYFGATLAAVKGKKHRLGIGRRSHVDLPPLDALKCSVQAARRAATEVLAST